MEKYQLFISNGIIEILKSELDETGFMVRIDGNKITLWDLNMGGPERFMDEFETVIEAIEASKQII